MKTTLLMAAFLSLFTSQFASAKTVTLEGAKADSLIARHFPDAEIPGPVKGRFQYVTKNGQTLTGYAECFVPAMGGRSNGFESSCEVIY